MTTITTTAAASLFAIFLAPALADDKADSGLEKVFIQLNNYSRTLNEPMKDSTAGIYQQTAVYDWSGGRFERIEITLVRNPTNFKKQFNQLVKGQNNPPKDVEVNGKKGWLWENKEESSKFDRVTGRLALVLNDDKAIFLEQKGTGANLVEVAKKFDFEKVDKALADAGK
jgi:hypothetical protein